jgi:hypothetical protein
MMPAGESCARPQSELDEVEQLKQLVAIQTQIVELARQNELTARECEALRQELSDRLRRPRPVNAGPLDPVRRLLERGKEFWTGRSHAQG